MKGMLSTKATVFLLLNPFRVQASVLGGGVVPSLTLPARKDHQLSHPLLQYLTDDAGPNGMSTFPDSET